MRSSWFALHTSLIRNLNLRSSQADFQTMQQAYPELAGVGSIPFLIEHQHVRDGDPAARFSVIRALLIAAQSGQRFRSTAHLMVIVALWPGLDAVFWRLARGFPDARDDLPAEILARIGEAILTLDLDRVTAVTATLLRNVERDIRRDLVAARLSVGKLRETPLLIKTPSGYVQQSPWLNIANKQMELMGRYMAEIGLTPASRSRIAVAAGPAAPEPLEIVFRTFYDGQDKAIEGKPGEILLDGTDADL